MFGVIKHFHDVRCGIEPATIRVHLEYESRGAVAFGRFHGAAQEHEKGRGNFTVQWDNDYIAFVNYFARVRRAGKIDIRCRQHDKRNQNRGGSPEPPAGREIAFEAGD